MSAAIADSFKTALAISAPGGIWWSPRTRNSPSPWILILFRAKSSL